MSRARAPLGIFGGTFDPVHCGHLELAREILVGLRLDEVILMPAGDPPHRSQPIASAGDRLAMVTLAIAGVSGLRVDGRETVRKGPSYTVLTLAELRAERPFQPLALVLGADAFEKIASWYRWREVFELAHIVVVARPGTAVGDEHGHAFSGALQEEWHRRYSCDAHALESVSGGSILIQAITPHDISASMIRAALAAGRPEEVCGLLPATVLAYIGRNHLYLSLSDDHKDRA